MARCYEDCSDDKRAQNRQSSPGVLSGAGIGFHSNNHGAHLVVSHAHTEVDFWPGTGLWIVRHDRSRGRGVFKLVRYLKNREPKCASTTVETKIKEAETILSIPSGSELPSSSS